MLKQQWIMTGLAAVACLFTQPLLSDNQTPKTTPIDRDADDLSFRIKIGLESYTLPAGLHSYVSAIYDGKWLLLAGRTNGLHGFADDNFNFPADRQNLVVYVVDPVAKTVAQKALDDVSSGLTTAQQEYLSVTSAQFYQWEDQLYVSGGYGYQSVGDTFNTKPIFTAINIPGLIHWVVNPSVGETAAQHIRQFSDPFFQVTGGTMARVNDDLSLLIFGQNFDGAYRDTSNGDYTQQVRRFKLIDDGANLSFVAFDSYPENPDPNFRRRDLNIVPAVFQDEGEIEPYFVAYSGVFTESGGIWTVPVIIDEHGKTKMNDPTDPKTFKQGMNNYICPTIELANKHAKENFVIFLGGISYGYFQDGVFKTDAEIPFINQVTTIEINRKGKCKQYLMDAEYPIILYEDMDPSQRLLFGAAAQFFPVPGLPTFENGVIKLHELKKDRSLLIGYVVGGIQSKLPNTNTMADSAACPYIFPVFLERD